jgi:hypothetical protein
MLIDKYISAYDFNEFHSIKVNAPANVVYEKMLSCDVSRSFLVSFLFRLRGISKSLYTINHLTRMGFVKLDEQTGIEIVYGIITSSPTFSCCESKLTPTSFVDNINPSIIKAVINFQVLEESNSTCILSTETRVLCGSKKMRTKFGVYWFFVKPFSQLIRRSMLTQIKQQILKP